MKQNTTEEQSMDLEKQLIEICTSLYQTGFNSAKNNIKHFPTPVGYRVDQLLQLITDREKQRVSESEKLLQGWEEYFEDFLIDTGLDTEKIKDFIANLLQDQRQKLLERLKHMKKTQPALMNFIEVRQEQIKQLGFSEYDVIEGYNKAIDDMLASLQGQEV